jgi:hypothetical protein
MSSGSPNNLFAPPSTAPTVTPSIASLSGHMTGLIGLGLGRIEGEDERLTSTTALTPTLTLTPSPSSSSSLTGVKRRRVDEVEVEQQTLERSNAKFGVYMRRGLQAAKEFEKYIGKLGEYSGLAHANRLESELAQMKADLDQASTQLDEVTKQRDEATKQRDEAITQRDKAIKERDEDRNAHKLKAEVASRLLLD